MILHYVVVKALLCVPIKYLSLYVTNKANVLDVIISFRFQASQLRKRVYNYTKNDIKKNGYHYHEKRCVKNLSEEFPLAVPGCIALVRHKVTDTTTSSDSIVQC